ncbi:SDR family NAD(P)-dependent oxidoreductase [Geomonas paludis]|uniref:MaoC-like domain-containing protein n=1 Tax=Geomonas paludis TaxID=2740185 RepID=A0A6V8MVD2_9BACT|nr:SDR family NAD(P)-dependent oxidoreductase [Geomonas paludis]GFO63834.1 hypothetical protein GMPD_17530 [Geomonas paludis]
MGHCTFSAEMSQLFARLSGDCNPMHLDQEAARRTYFGQTIVHGIHLLLQGLERVCSGSPELVPRQVRAAFTKPVPTGATVEYLVQGDAATGTLRLNGLCQGNQVFRALVHLQPSGAAAAAPGAQAAPAAAELPWELEASELEGMQGEARLPLPAAGEAARLFPALASSWPAQFLHGMLATTYVVGMRAPGLHSVFSNLDISFDYASAAPQPERVNFRVVQLHPTIRRCDVEADGAGWRAQLQAFVRPKPCAQAGYRELASLVEAGAFAGQRALVVGGSRGIGEATAKLLAAGGADVVLTYARSARSAEAVTAEIVAGGGRAQAVSFEVESEADPAALLPSGWHPSHLYYFVTPPIAGDRYDFNAANLERYLLYYVTLFARVLDALRRESAQLRHVLWPSSVAVEEVPSGMVEYAMAKSAGELLCQALMRGNPDLTIVAPRLPRIRTDLTANPLAADGLDAAQVMLPILTAMATTGPDTAAKG